MGTVSVLYFLNKMSQKYKDDTIAQFVPIGAPFLGATKVIMNKIQLNKRKNDIIFKYFFYLFLSFFL